MFEVKDTLTGDIIVVSNYREAAMLAAYKLLPNSDAVQKEMTAYYEGALMMWDTYNTSPTFNAGGYIVTHKA